MLYPRASDVGINYPYLFPGTKLDPDKIPNISMQGFTAINNAAYPGSWNDFVFLWSDNVTKITGNHTFKAGVSVERSGMNDRIQLSFAHGAGDDEPERLVPLLRRARAGHGATRLPTRCSGLFDDYTEFGNKPNTNCIGMGYDFLRPGQLEADAQADARARPALFAVAAVGHDEHGPWRRSSRSSTTRPRAGHRPRRRLRRQRRPFNGIVLPGDGPTRRGAADFPQLANLQRLYHGVPNGFAETRRTASSRGSGWPTRSTSGRRSAAASAGS